MLHAVLSSLTGYSRTALPYMLWEIRDFHENQDFPRSRKANSFRPTSTQKTKQRRWGNFTQEPPQLQSNKKCKVRRSVGKPFLVWGVYNCRDFVSSRRQNCLLGESRTMRVLVVFEPLLTLVL